MYMDVSSFEDLLQCMICFESYRSPKMLKCGHTFCQECLEGYLSTYQQQKKALANKLPCPTCRDLTTMPSNGIEGLRNDFKIKKIEAMFKTVNVKERKASGNCDSCRSQKKTNPSRYLCSNCSINYCESCLQKHNKNPLFKNHQVLNKSLSTVAGDVLCTVHRGEYVKYFCRTCEAMVCTLCVMNEHSEGHEVLEADEVFRKQQTEIRELHGIVEGKLTDLKEKGDLLEKLRCINQQSVQSAEMAIKEKTRDSIQMLKEEETSLLADLRKKKDEKHKRIFEEIEIVNFYLAKAGSLQDFATSTLKKNNLRLMAIHEELIQRMRTVSEFESNMNESSWKNVIKFLPSRLEPSIGRIDEVEATEEELQRANEQLETLRPISSPIRPVQRSPSVRASNDNIAIQSENRPKLLVNINTVGNGPGQLRDPLAVACLLNGDIVVAEWGNKRIQIFDSVGKHVRMVGSGHVGPQGVSVTLRGNIMVTDASNKRLEVFSPSGNSMSKWGFGKFYGPCGICICPNGNCAISDSAEHAVSIYQGEKKCLKRFGSRGSRSHQFDNPLYVGSNPNNDILVSDSGNHTVKLYDQNGNLLKKIGSEGSADGQLMFPRGVVTDQDGYVVVADRNNDRVSLFTISGQFVRHILTKQDGIKEPYGLAYTPTNNLVVPECGQNRASLKIFEFSS